MGLAILFRLLASIFARGWGMFDDHFIVIESAQSWVDGHDYNSWLPWSPDNRGPTGHNFFYPGFHFLLFTSLEFFGITDPQWKMFIVRLLHGAFSLITVYCGYRISEQIGGKQPARIAGILLAVLWFMPWMSVRNLVEMTTIPLVMLGYWMIIRKESDKRLVQSWLLAGILFGLAFNIRPQTVFFPVGLGIIYLFRASWKKLLLLASGSMISVLAIQGVVDTLMWGYPFAELLGYANVCFTERNDYISLPWYNYFLTIGGLLIPPVSLFLMIGFVKKWRDQFIFFFPTLLFFIFHSYFPNKQERFILPLIPILISVGVVGWNELMQSRPLLIKRAGLVRGCWKFFWVVNTIILLVFTFTYSKKARVESMRYLSRYSNISEMAVIDADNSPEQQPKFYLGQWPHMGNEDVGGANPDTVLDRYTRKEPNLQPRFVLFTGDKDLSTLIFKTQQKIPGLVYETTINPGFIDWLVHWLNPINKNRRVIIYRNVHFYPQKLD